MNTIAPHDPVWLAVADLHGHRAHFNALLAWAEAEFGAGLHLCTLGDYVDNGREIPALLDDLLPAVARIRLFQAFLDSAVSEQIARMVAMKAATEASEEMIKTLSRQYNRARQTQITMELLDIVGGANALA